MEVEKKKTTSKKTTTSKPRSKTSVKTSNVKKKSTTRKVNTLKKEEVKKKSIFDFFKGKIKLITLIGIITLLLLVLGATYAYFQVGVGEGGVVHVRATSDEVGNVSLSGDGGELHINLKASDISNNQGGTFWGTSLEEDYSLVEEKIEVAKIEATALPEDIKYTCTFDVTVKPEEGNLTNVVGGDLTFSTTKVFIDGVESDKLAFSTLTEEKVYHASTVLDSGDINYLYVSARIISSSENDNESWLRNINGKFKVSSDNLKCTASKSKTDGANYYTISGKMLDENGDPLTGYAVVMSDPKVIELESDGSFEIKRIEAGTHDLYYMGEDNPENLTKEEVKEQAITTTSFRTANVAVDDKKLLKLDDRSRMLNLNVELINNFSLYNYMKNNADTETTIDYNVRSGATGQETSGIYTINSNTNPVYYYRGEVNNNVIFGGFCWKAIRTTETGGVKLIYNGVAYNNTCTNSGTSTQIGTSMYNSTNGDNTDIGYKHASYTQTYQDGGRSSSTVSVNYSGYNCYGGSYTFDSSTGYYTVPQYTNGTRITALNGLPTIYNGNGYYTCMSSPASYSPVRCEAARCSRLYYIEKGYSYNSSSNTLQAYYYTSKIVGSGSYSNAVSNAVNSTLKSTIENWYASNMTSYSSYIEDTQYCNDRSMTTGGNNNTLSSSYSTYGYDKQYTAYSAVARSSNITKSLKPSLTCATRDAFTTSTTTGNGKSSYPVGLITSDEAVLAGFNSSAANSTDYIDNNYLNSGTNYWTMTPAYFDSSAYVNTVLSTGIIGNASIGVSYGVRPVVSIKSGTLVIGTGTTSDPFIVDLES